MLGTETDSVAGVRVSVVVVVEGVSFLLHPAINRQSEDKAIMVFFIRNRFVFIVMENSKGSHVRTCDNLPASGTKLEYVLLMVVQKTVVLVCVLCNVSFP